MKKETVEEFLKRGGKIKKVDTSTAYLKYFGWNGTFQPYTKNAKKTYKKKRSLEWNLN